MQHLRQLGFVRYLLTLISYILFYPVVMSWFYRKSTQLNHLELAYPVKYYSIHVSIHIVSNGMTTSRPANPWRDALIYLWSCSSPYRIRWYAIIEVHQSRQRQLLISSVLAQISSMSHPHRGTEPGTCRPRVARSSSSRERQCAPLWEKIDTARDGLLLQLWLFRWAY